MAPGFPGAFILGSGQWTSGAFYFIALPAMALPFFYLPSYSAGQTEIVLDEDNSRHIIQVLRMQSGERLQLTDGKGVLLEAEIIEDHKKKCRVRVLSSRVFPPRPKQVTLAISLLKNANRFEWMLEKAMEIGVGEIIPLLCQRTEKQHFRQDRMQGILVSALLQSQQVWLPVLHPPTAFGAVLQTAGGYTRRYIAHCLEEEKTSLKTAGGGATGPSIILIGPEGDFSPEEIQQALAGGYQPVTLGGTRLRTETAGIVAATLLCID